MLTVTRLPPNILGWDKPSTWMETNYTLSDALIRISVPLYGSYSSNLFKTDILMNTYCFLERRKEKTKMNSSAVIC